MNIKQTSGGICAPDGFKAAGTHCGIAKDKNKKDLAIIYTTARANAAAVYTQNKVKGAPITVTQANLKDGHAQVIVCNSGNANTCNADGEAVANEMCKITADALRIRSEDVIVASTGVIGQKLDIEPIREAMPELARQISPQGSKPAVQAIMTTDTAEKEIAITFDIKGKTCKLGGIAKGSGMIHPNMATMLAFLTTDVAISSEMLQKALSTAVADTFNMVSVDGDTSTNDMVAILASGNIGNPVITQENEDYQDFVIALMYCCIYLARMIAKDGEGATKLLECAVSGAPSEESAKLLAKSVVCSSLFKAAMFGADANWGRVLCALGYADTDFDVTKTEVRFKNRTSEILVCENGAGVDFDEEKAKQVLSSDEIEIIIDLHQGEGASVAWGCDLTYDYVKINGDYRS